MLDITEVSADNLLALCSATQTMPTVICYYTVSGKKKASSFSTISLAFFDRFL